MATTNSVPTAVVCTNSTPRGSANIQLGRARPINTCFINSNNNNNPRISGSIEFKNGVGAPNYTKARRWTKLQAGLTDIEPDLSEDPHDRWATNGVPPDEFEYGVYDGHHTFYEGAEKKGTFWGAIAEEYNSMEPPTGFQGLISWLFLPAVAAGMYFHAPGEYLYIGAAIFTVVFCIIEMDKPDKPHNFEPQIYNMERGARDKLISDYNTMDIWDFNEKYGDLWDFTIKKDGVEKR